MEKWYNIFMLTALGFRLQQIMKIADTVIMKIYRKGH